MSGGKHNGKILLIGNKADDAWLVSRVCQSVGHEMQQALDEEKALKILQAGNGTTELVVLDVDMPGIKGAATLKRIRVWYPNLPVIILSAVHGKQLECEFLGIEAFIHKPYPPESFISRILFVLDWHKNRRRGLLAACKGNPSAKVLIANERKEVCELLCVVLTEDVLDAHFDVAWGCSGGDVLQLSWEFKPDIGIVDVRMPDMWGHELINLFKAGRGYAPKDFLVYSSFIDPEQMALISKLNYPVFLNLSQLEVLVDHLKKICVRHQLVCEK